MSAGTRAAGLAGLLAGAAGARLAYAALRRRPPGGTARWERTNHAGRRLTLLEGPAVAAAAGAGMAATPGATARMRLAGCVAAVGAGCFGAYDDLAGSSGSRGFAGHLAALRRGEITSGSVKLAGIGATGAAAGALLPGDAGGAFGGALLRGAVIAGSANLVNLFDLRPGRALKVTVLAGSPLLASGAVAGAPLGAAVALLPDDLGEAAMLGDGGANALGAALGVAAAARLPAAGLVALLTVLVGLTAASERVSFTRVIESYTPLRRLDELGRRDVTR